MRIKTKVQYLVEVDQIKGEARIMMPAADLKTAIEELIQAEHLRVVNYYADGMPMQAFLDRGAVLRDKLEQLFS